MRTEINRFIKLIFFWTGCLILIISCSGQNTNSKNESKQQKSLTNKQVAKELIGIWWNASDKEAPTASFQINENTIYYPDQEEQSEFKYQIEQDSLFIFFNGFVSSSKIIKLRNDSLELITDGEKTLYVKKEK
ncbi:MAG: hypothetical protein WC780_06515 [Lentimicrobiaceae bacterium]|jgi:hypothetical protein